MRLQHRDTLLYRFILCLLTHGATDRRTSSRAHRARSRMDDFAADDIAEHQNRN